MKADEKQSKRGILRCIPNEKRAALSSGPFEIRLGNVYFPDVPPNLKPMPAMIW
jgi:hypothetical protein